MVQTYTIGPYKVGSTLGVGSFGKVKLGEHTITGLKVAIKIVNKSKMQDLDMQEKIMREISILKCLNHPHVIRLYELIDTPTDIFVVMEYVPRGELFDHIVQKSRLSENEGRRFFQQIVSGVEYCHQHMVCHRDLKPENVLLDINMNVKVADFGLSNFMKDGEFLKTSCGSPNYASPEVVSGKAYAGPEADIWSCGVILYALLCGCLPFDDEHVPNLFKKIKHGNFTLPGHLSENSRNLIVRMLAVDPSKRITFAQIRQHPWFKQSLPMYLSSSSFVNRTIRKVDMSILEKMRQLGYDVDENSVLTFDEPSKTPSHEAIAYQLLLDKEANQSLNSNLLYENTPTVFSPDICKRLAKIYFPQNNHLSYNSRSINQQFHQSLGYHVDGNAKEYLNIDTSSIDVPRWKLGLECFLDSSTIMTNILNVLKDLNYEWYLITSYHVRCRPKGKVRSEMTETTKEKYQSTESSSKGFFCKDLILSLMLYKVGTGKYIVDIQLFDGPLMKCISEASSIIAAVIQKCVIVGPPPTKMEPNITNL